jgi:hypothetical protein
MTTLRVKFRPSTVTNQEGTLYYQVIHHRAVRWISSGYHLFRREWNEKEGSVIIPRDQTHEDRRTHLQLIQSRVEGKLRQMREVIRQNTHPWSSQCFLQTMQVVYLFGKEI